MATSFTKADALGIYATIDADGAKGLGGFRSGQALKSLFGLTSSPIPNLCYSDISGAWTPGDTVSVEADGTGVRLSLSGDTAGAFETLPDGGILTLERPGNPNQFIRVYNEDGYLEDGLEGGDTLTLLVPFDNVLGSIDLTASAQSTYGCIALVNQSDSPVDITGIKVGWVELGTESASETTQLGVSGAGTLESSTAGSFADWPASGYCGIYKNDNSLREVVYYSSHDNDTLTVPAGGRAIAGTEEAGAATDTLHSFSGVAIGKDDPSPDSALKEIADSSTAPSAVTFSYPTSSAALENAFHTTLQPAETLGLWLLRKVPDKTDGVASPESDINLYIKYTVSGTEYTNYIRGKYRVGNPDDALYQVYIGEDADPDLTAAPDTESATLPIVEALTPPGAGEKDFRVVVQQKNKYGLKSKNIYPHSTIIDSNGDPVAQPITSPRNVTVEQLGSGEIVVSGVYDSGADDDPADTWVIYAGFTAPNPSVDSPVATSAMGSQVVSGFGSSQRIAHQLAIPLGLSLLGSTIHILLRARRSSDSAESENTTATTIFIDTAAPQSIGDGRSTTAYGINEDTELLEEVTHSASSPLVKSYAQRGTTWLHVEGDDVFRAVVNDDGTGRVYLHPDWSLVNSTITGAGTASNDVIEVAGANTVYLRSVSVFARQRVVELDISSKEVRCVSFIEGADLQENPSPGTTSFSFEQNAGIQQRSYLGVYDHTRERWVPFIQINHDKTLSFGFELIQAET